MADAIDMQRVRYGTDLDQFVDVYRPEAEPCGTIVSIHGGYWRSRYGLDLNEPMCAHMAARGWTVINIEYRRVEPDRFGVWPSMSADVLAACSLEAAAHGPRVVVGHSAGGHLALWAAAHVTVDAVVALAPVADLAFADEQGLSDHAVRELLGQPFDKSQRDHLEASPQHMLPIGCPQLVVHGTADVNVPFELSRNYVSAARAAGDGAELLDPDGVDHFDIIDPTHSIWRAIDHQLDQWLTAGFGPQTGV